MAASNYHSTCRILHEVIQGLGCVNNDRTSRSFLLKGQDLLTLCLQAVTYSVAGSS